MSYKRIGIIQARLSSKRLPGKSLLHLNGKPLIQHVIERAMQISGLDAIILATPEEDVSAFSDSLPPLCKIIGGPRDDVLLRYWQIVTKSDADIIIRLTGDCPLIAPEVCQEVLEAVMKYDFAFASNDTQVGNAVRSGYPDGLDCECFTAELLERANREATKATDREHVTPWMRVHATSRVVVSAESKGWPKLSVDTRADLLRVRRIMARIPAGDYSWAATRKAIEEERLC